MDSQKAKQITDYIFKEVFGKNNPYSLEQLRERFALDIPSVKNVTCTLSKTETWTISSQDEKIASQQAIAERFEKDEWMRKKKPLNSIGEILSAWEQINYLTGEKYLNSNEVAESDGIYNSASVFHSLSIFDSKNIIFSYKLFDCNYLLASRDNSSCTLGIRMKENLFCSTGFEISWSHKVSSSMFIHDGSDLYECLFCSHLRSKRYCVANMQFEKEEYFRLKNSVVDWILCQYDPGSQ